MKRFIFLFFCTVFIIDCHVLCIAQDGESFLEIGNSKIFTNGNVFNYTTSGSEFANINQWSKALEIVAERKKQYVNNGFIKKPKSHPKFDLPLRLKEGIADPGYFTITAYFDHDTLYPDYLIDYMCGNLTYDLDSGYNHRGTDFFLWPHPWLKMENDAVEVVAAEAGMLLLKQDGNFDQQCEENSDDWNGICILHDDGSTSWYIHLKKNSLTNVGIGQELAKGEYLGIIGSSGSSLAPHLHFEVLDSAFNKIDPFTGPCNGETVDSWWEEQPAYKEPGINKISTNAHLPVFPDCPQSEITNESATYYPGDSIFLLAYFRNFSIGDQVMITINRPDNSVFASWSWNNQYGFYPASWTFFLMFLNDDHYGTWNYQLNFNGITYNANFELKDPQGVQNINEREDFYIYPIPFTNIINILVPLNIELNPEIKILSSLGQEISIVKSGSISASLFQYDMTGFPSGIYFIRMDFKTGCTYRKILKR